MASRIFREIILFSLMMAMVATCKICSATDPEMKFGGDVSCGGVLKVGGHIIRDSEGWNAICMSNRAIGIGWDDPRTIAEGGPGPFIPRELFQIGVGNGITFHNGISKIIGFNMYVDTSTSPSVKRHLAAGSSGQVMLDNTLNRLLLYTASSGAQDATATMVPGISINTETGNVGIKTQDPASYAALDVNGSIHFQPRTNQPTDPYVLYAYSGNLWANNSSGTSHQISSHYDPREVEPQAQTSFSDPTVVLPYSIHHENNFIGKGAVIDMTKMVAYIERKMQSELGAEAGRLVFVYDLPKEQCKTVDEAEIDRVMEDLQKTPPIKVAIGTDGSIPPEALEEVDEMIETPRTITDSDEKIDFKSRRVIKVDRLKTIVDKVKTGKKTTRLKIGWTFSKEKGLCRPATLDDLDLDKIASKHPALPQWVLDRVKGGKQTKQSLSSLVEDIKKKMQASAAKSPDKQTLASNSNIK